MNIPAFPQFQHDSACCKFLGRWTGPVEGVSGDIRNYDLYHCMQGTTDFPTLVARYGDDGPDYNAGITFANNGMIPSLVEAKRLAVKLGLSVEGGAK